MSIRTLALSVLLIGVALGATRPAAAVSIVEPLAYGSWRSDPSDFALGAGVGLGVGSFEIVPTVEYVFVDNATDWVLNVDAHVPLIPLGVVAVYVGGGLGRYSHDPESGDSDSSTGVNLLTGVKIQLKNLRPFGELKYTFAGQDNLVFNLGTRFNLFK